MTGAFPAGTLKGMRMSQYSAMARLPDHEREILYRASSLNWPVERIARDLGLPSDVVKLRLHDALHRLVEFAVTQSPGMP